MRGFTKIIHENFSLLHKLLTNLVELFITMFDNQVQVHAGEVTLKEG